MKKEKILYCFGVYSMRVYYLGNRDSNSSLKRNIYKPPDITLKFDLNQMKGKASASIFSFQGHIIILRLLSFFIKLFIRFISNSPDFKIWILWLQKRPNQSPLIAKLYHYTIPRPLGKYCWQCQRHSLYVFQRFCLFRLKRKKIVMRIGS